LIAITIIKNQQVGDGALRRLLAIFAAIAIIKKYL
jgi:hypothetical protein